MKYIANMLNLKIFVRNNISEILISKLLLEKKMNVSLIPTAYGVNVNTKDKSVDMVDMMENRIEFSLPKSE
tara:strand:- start:14693 stop:14905 length:213 start_codon:yes stop_codon:yes gene_type:complete